MRFHERPKVPYTRMLTREITHDEWRMICDGRQRRTAKREAWLVKVAEQFGRNSDEYQRAQLPDEPWIDPTEYSLSNPLIIALST